MTIYYNDRRFENSWKGYDENLMKSIWKAIKEELKRGIWRFYMIFGQLTKTAMTAKVPEIVKVL